jgi:hypothetical protein
MTRAHIAEGEWLMLARVDLRLGEIIERSTSVANGDLRAREDDVLFAAIEILRSRQRPTDVLLVCEHEIHLYQRSRRSAHGGLVVVSARDINLGLLLTLMRSAAQSMDV